MAAMLSGEGANKSLPVWQFWLGIVGAIATGATIYGATMNRITNIESNQTKSEVMYSRVYDALNDLRERAARIEAKQDDKRNL